MDLVMQAKGRGSCTMQIPPPRGGGGGAGAGGAVGGGPFVLEEDAVVRVLARRPERTGSKLLKEEYRMSKRLK